MNADFDILSSRRRQSVWAPVFIAITALRRLGLGQLAIAAVLVATGRLPGPELLVVPLIVAALAAWAVVAWYRYTFVVENDTLIVDSGVVSSRRVVVPLARIQSVDIEQQLLHRPIGLVEVKIDTAGGEAEIVVSATSRDIAEALQRLTGSGVVRATPSPGETGDAPPAAPQREVLAKRSASDLLVMALTNRPLAGLVLIAPLMGMADDVLGTFGLWPESAVPGDLPQVGSLAVSIALTLVVALGALVALQIAWTFVTEFDLTLSRDDRVLRRESGLFDRRSASSAITRIQQLETDQSLLQRLVDHRTIRLPTAGESDSLRLPGASRSELDVLRCLTIDADARLADLERTIDPSATLYWFRWPAVAVLVGTTAAAITTSPLALLAWAALAPLWLYNTALQRSWRWDLTETGLATSRGVLSTERTEVTMRRVQRATVTQNLYQRRRGVATFVLRTAEGSVEIPFLTQEQAEALRDRVLYTVLTDRRPWF